MNIYYCDVCRRRISTIEVDKGLAVVQNADGVFCSDCAGEIVSGEAEPTETHKTPSGSRNRRTPAKGRAIVATAASVAPRRTTQTAQRPQRTESGNHYRYAYIQPPPEKVKAGKPLSLVMCAVIGGGVLAFGAIVLVVNSWASKPDPKAKVEKPAKKGVSIQSIDAAESNPRKANNPVSAEDTAAQAYAKLEADWKALGPGEAAKRISLGEKFLADHNGTIIASRVRVKIEEFRKDKQTASH